MDQLWPTTPGISVTLLHRSETANGRARSNALTKEWPMKRVFPSLIWILLTCIFVGVIGYSTAGIAAPVQAAQNNQQAEIEKGRVALGQACVKCHNLQPIQIQRKSAEKWRDTVYSMISRGGMILP